MIFALVDCNNFYVSCERVFNPTLNNRPVIILSNNDGCVIARSQEAKQLGIAMGTPAFEISGLLEKHEVQVFSSNYKLYGDMSQRMLSVLSQLSPDIEPYSIDEAFLRIDRIKQFNPRDYGVRVRAVIDQWLGLPVSIGIGPTKTLAKAANYLAKQDPDSSGIFDFLSADSRSILKKVPVEEVWGVGPQHAAFLKQKGIGNAYELMQADERMIRKQMHVNGARTQKELSGISCIPLEQAPPAKKSVCISRSYGRPMTEYAEVESATSAFVAQTAEKLRKNKLLCSRLTVFVMTNRFATGPRYVNFQSQDLAVPTHDTAELNTVMGKLLRQIFRKGYRYKKSGVLAEVLVPESEQQLALFDNVAREKRKQLMKVLDEINYREGRDKIVFALQGFDRKWKMKQEKLSRNYTGRWDEILRIDS